MGRQLSRDEGSTAKLKSGSRRGKISKARRLFGKLSVVKMEHPGAKAARLLGVITSVAVRAANSEELPEVETYT